MLDARLLSVSFSDKQDLRFLKQAVKAAGVRSGHAAEIIAAAAGFRASMALLAALKETAQNGSALSCFLRPAYGVDRAVSIVPNLKPEQAEAIEYALTRGHVERELLHAEALFDRLFEATPKAGAQGSTAGAAALRVILAMRSGDAADLKHAPHLIVTGHGKSSFLDLASALTGAPKLGSCTTAGLLDRFNPLNVTEGAIVDVEDSRTFTVLLDVIRMIDANKVITKASLSQDLAEHIDLESRRIVAAVSDLPDVRLPKTVLVAVLAAADPSDRTSIHQEIARFLSLNRMMRLAGLLAHTRKQKWSTVAVHGEAGREWPKSKGEWVKFVTHS